MKTLPCVPKIRSLAKINLDLRVLDRRPDGYHNLTTIFQTVSLADTIEIDYVPARRLTVDLDSNPPIPGNLIEKAAEILGIPGRFTIRLTKRIPMGAGLGGGSSNAAATLLAIPALTGKNVPLEKLADLASQLGSDVPFFLLGGTALGLGRGTELHPLPDFKPFPAIIVTPGIHVSTAEAYAAIDRLRHDAARGTKNADLPSNDFEAVVFPLHRQLKLVKGRLLDLGAELALMLGSGSALFGIFAHREKRDSAVVSLRRELGYDRVFPVSLVGRGAYRSLWWRQLRASGKLKTWPPQDRYAR
jgi:4-diphosphocytidyl-2-C-methyl-D-erythritol kinase